MRPSHYLGDHTSLITTVHDHRMYVDTLDTIAAPHLILDGNWEGWVSRFIRQTLPRGACFVDVGAHLGWYTLLAHSCGARWVHSFEPNQRLHGLLERTLSINGLSARTTLYDVALLDKESKEVFAVPLHWSGNGRIEPTGERDSHEDERPTQRTVVTTKTLDDLLTTRSGQHAWAVDFIKIDAEGAESRILRGAAKLIEDNPQMRLLVEHHCLTEEYETMRWLLDTFGFALGVVNHNSRVEEVPVEKLDQIPDSEMLFLSRG